MSRLLMTAGFAVKKPWLASKTDRAGIVRVRRVWQVRRLITAMLVNLVNEADDRLNGGQARSHALRHGENHIIFEWLKVTSFAFYTKPASARLGFLPSFCALQPGLMS
ncbi:MAG: hypothetical protein JSR96_00550 [Proteobacteria bacterium]|nr:hypothetical protein [Pseudomonadota bacterium]